MSDLVLKGLQLLMEYYFVIAIGQYDHLHLERVIALDCFLHHLAEYQFQCEIYKHGH